MISINPDDIMKNYAIFQNILAKTKKDGEVVISKEDVLDREALVKQIVDLAMVLSEKRKNCCFAIEGEWGSGKSFVLENIQECLQPEQSEETGADRFFVVRYDCWKYDYYEEPIVAIISVLRDQIDQYINLLTDDAKRVLLETVKNTIRNYAKHIIDHSYTINSKFVCEADQFIERMVFIIAGLTNEYKNKACEKFYCEDEEIEKDLIFSRKIYELLKI